MSEENLENEIQKAEKAVDVLSLMRRWNKELGKIASADKKMVLDYLNSKHRD